MLALEQVKAALECRAVASNLLRRLSKSPYRSPTHTITVTRTYFTRHDLDRVPTMFHHGPCRFNAQVLDCLRGQLGSPSTCSIPKQSAQQTNLQGVNFRRRGSGGQYCRPNDKWRRQQGYERHRPLIHWYQRLPPNVEWKRTQQAYKLHRACVFACLLRRRFAVTGTSQPSRV
jgi:hypothetical protein